MSRQLKKIYPFSLYNTKLTERQKVTWYEKKNEEEIISNFRGEKSNLKTQKSKSNLRSNLKKMKV